MLFFAALVALGIGGCASVDDYLANDIPEAGADGDYVSTVNYMEIRDPNVCPRDKFTVGEIPAMRISGCSGDVRILVVEIESEQLIVGQTVRLKDGRTYYRAFPHIQPGKYKITMAADGMLSSSCAFTVTN